jgi:hypothetical protein
VVLGTESKQKSPKKKPFSITRVATEKYQTPTSKTTTTVKAPEFFAPLAKSSPRSASPERATLKKNEISSAKVRVPRKKKVTTGNETPKPKKPTARRKAKTSLLVKPKLLSPTQAAHRFERQNVLFGTSSQLRKEDSPEYVRQLQQVLRESEVFAPANTETPFVGYRHGDNVRRSGRGLWSEAAAKMEGDSIYSDTSQVMFPIAEAENFPVAITIDTYPNKNSTEDSCETLVQRITGYEFTSIDDYSLRVSNPDQEDNMFVTRKPCDEWASIDDFSPTPAAGMNSLPLNKLSSTTGGFVVDTSGQEPSSDPSSLPDLPGFMGTQTTRALVSQSVTTNRKALRALSTNTKQLIDNNSKASLEGHSAKDKIANADKRSKTQILAAEQGPLPKKKPRGRPPKAKASEDTSAKMLCTTPTKATPPDDMEGNWQHIDDIEDDEPNLTPSPPRRRGRPLKESASQLPELVTTEAVSKRVNTFMASAAHADWPGIQPILFQEITRVVKAAPPTTDTQKPSWAEKISMYDPIVIEDLSAWLNDDMGLRITVKGKEDKLQSWMVQKWCEEKSICCLWREGLWGGVKKNY